MPNTTEKRVAIVTGASRGIGAAAALALAAQGRHVICVARNADKLQVVCDQITEQGGTAAAATCDISTKGSLAELIDGVVSEHGRLDILVNNAGITRDNLLLRMSDEEFDDVIATNLRSVFEATRAAARTMIRGKWGRIINIGSVAGLVGNAGQTNYAAAKAGIIGMTRSIAKELAPKQVTANVVAPGFIQTDMTDVLPDTIKENVKQITPLRRFGQPEEIAHAIAFLADDKAGYITGQVVTVDGGMTMA